MRTNPALVLSFRSNGIAGVVIVAELQEGSVSIFKKNRKLPESKLG